MFDQKYYGLSDDELIRIVKSFPEEINHMVDPPEAAVLHVINNGKPNHIWRIKNPSEAIQLAAIRQKPALIRALDYPCEEAQILAVVFDKNLYRHIEHPTEKVTKIYNLKIL